MPTSKLIAGLMGPTFVAMAAAMLLNLNSMPKLTEEISHEPMLILVSGVLLFIAGLAIVRVHNRWAAEWSTVVTVLGWLAILSGLVRMLFPIQLETIVPGVGERSDVIGPALVVFLLLGLFLTYKAYGPE
jgi:uncharacterized membrane protein HdeD (DUF308 family)